MKVLHAYLRPKDIPEVLGPLNEIPCDKLLINYYAYPFPHRIARDFFLSHEEYTHLAMHTNDLIVTKENYHDMMLNFIHYPFLDVISGVCNVDMEEEKDYWNVCYNLPTLELQSRRYHWVKKGSFNGIQRVRFAGFPYMWIKRQILETIDSNSNRPYFDGTDLFGKDGYAADLWFCHGLYHSNIPIYADSNIDMFHMRYHGEMQVGKKESQTIWVKDDKPIHIKEFDKGIMREKPFPKKDMAVKIKERQKDIETTRINNYINDKRHA